MTRKYPHLSSPITLGRVTFRNRMFAAPTGATDITWDCCAGPGSRAFYENRAKGGSANVTVSELVVHPATDASHMLHLELQTPGSLASFTMMADAIRRHGAIPSVELSHSGQYAGTYLVDKEKKASLSQYGPCDGVRPDGRPVKALTKEQIADIVASYGEKAALAKRAGFEMVMIHAGHGWLINQFLSPYFNKRDDEYGGRLPIHVRCLLDEVANITIPNLERLISVLRSREISACLVVQAQSQLKAIYKEHADTIIGNCDTTLFLGGKEKTTLKEISEVLGKETIDSFNTSENRGRDVSHGLNYQKLGKELMSQDEIAVMDGGKCILQLRGVRPFFSDKYDITRHPKYKYLSDYDKKNTFDIEKFLKRQRRPVIIKPDTVFDYYEIDAADLQEVTE